MSGIFSIICFAGVVSYFVFIHREAFVKLNKMQKVGVLISYIMTTIIAGISIYYSSPFLTEHVQNRFLIWIIRIMVVIMTLWIAIFTLNGLLQKITKGIFPKIT